MKKIVIYVLIVTIVIIGCRKVVNKDATLQDSKVEKVVMQDLKIADNAMSVADQCKVKESIKLEEPPKPLRSSVRFVPPIITPDREDDDQGLVADNFALKYNKKKIIKDGEMAIKVNDVLKAKRCIDTLNKKYSSYYENERLENNSTNISYNLNIRIPSDLFELFISALEKGDGEILSKNVSSRDVTEEYIDVETRLQNKKLYFKKYKDILKKAVKVTDIMDIEERIRGLQEEIESKQGRLKYLSDQINYSTLILTITFIKNAIEQPKLVESFGSKVKNALYAGWELMISGILFIIRSWSLIIMLIIIFVIYKVFMRIRRKLVIKS